MGFKDAPEGKKHSLPLSTRDRGSESGSQDPLVESDEEEKYNATSYATGVTCSHDHW